MSSNIILLVQFGFLLTFAVLVDTYVWCTRGVVSLRCASCA